jgi:peptide/nickel transport system substrate-binding protein
MTKAGRRLLLALCLACAAPAWAADAVRLRVASAFDPNTMDPHAIGLLYNTRVVVQIYEALVSRDEQYGLEPALALSWERAGPLAWRFRLRPGVVFHDGTPFTADDAVFSIQRVLTPPSQRAFQLQGVTGARKVDALTIELQLDKPDAVLPAKLQYIAMMSRAWCEAHASTKPQDYNAQQETYAARNANGTGPFSLVRYEPDVRTTLTRHKTWWGASDQRSGNVGELSFITIKSDATRLAALTSGEVDLVLDPPVQDIARLKADPRIALAQTDDLGQSFLGFDQGRDELEGSDVKGRNPFKDRRVRQAVQHALNIPLIIDKVLRGQAVPAGALLSPRIEGVLPEMDRPAAYDPARARALLAEAGYAQGFSVGLDCVNVAWREAVCQAAAAMLTQVGIRTSLRSTPSGQFFPKLTGATTSFFEVGFTPLPDAWFTLQSLLRTRGPGGSGTFNAGRYSNPKLDALIDGIRVEPDLTRRRALITTALRLAAEDLPLVPLYRRKLTWAMARKVAVVQWPNDVLEVRWVRVK